MLTPILEPLAYDFFLRALLASAVVGVVTAVIGSYMVLRGLAFMGDALSHSAFPGVVVAYMLQLPFYLGAAVAAVATALAIGWVTRRGQLRGDTAIGVLFGNTGNTSGYPLALRLEWRATPRLSATLGYEPINPVTTLHGFFTTIPQQLRQEKQLTFELRRRWTY